MQASSLQPRAQVGGADLADLLLSLPCVPSPASGREDEALPPTGTPLQRLNNARVRSTGQAGSSSCFWEWKRRNLQVAISLQLLKFIDVQLSEGVWVA